MPNINTKGLEIVSVFKKSELDLEDRWKRNIKIDIGTGML